VSSSPPPDRAAPPAAAAYWRGWAEIRADLRVSARLVLVLALAGLLAGLLWWGLAPRADLRITDAGAVAVGNPPDELFIADDSVFTLVLAGFGLASGAAAWFLRRRRGVAIVLALALGCSLMSLVAWQLGQLLGAGPSEAELADVGRVVTTALELGSPPALAVAPFTAMLAYLLGVLYVRGDDLERAGEPIGGRSPADGADVATAPDDPARPDLVETPPPGRPSA
jgi:LPXTG-motif cell wall-anchored protein